jgi:hypothetical protein
MSYNYGIVAFLNAKRVPAKQAVKLFLEHCGKKCSYRDYRNASDYIQANWNRFATFIDKALLSGELKGQRVKLNTYYEEQAERNREIAQEFKSVELSKEEKAILNIPSHEFGVVHSVIAKAGFKSPQKEYSYTSKKLQNMPLILLLRENGLIDRVLEEYKKRKEANNKPDSTGFVPGTPNWDAAMIAAHG